jgi:tetratricopeptide (TPR) repeat protein
MAESHRDEIAKLESLYENNPDGRVFTHLAEAYRKAGELDRARDTVERGLTRHPEYSSAHVVLGRVLLDQGDRSGALDYIHTIFRYPCGSMIGRNNQ